MATAASPRAPLTAERAFGWALGAVYHAGHGFRVDGPEYPAELSKARRADARRMLSTDWGVNERDDLVGRMTNLGNEGHRRGHREMVNHYASLWRPDVAALRERFAGVIREGGDGAGEAARRLWLLDAVQADYAGIRASPLAAFDIARGVMLARLGLALGWVSEPDTWDYVTDAARDAARTYRCWEDYGADFRLSRNVWAGGTERDWSDDELDALMRKSSSPWRRLPWGAPGLEVPRPVRPLDPSAPLWTLERG